MEHVMESLVMPLYSTLGTHTMLVFQQQKTNFRYGELTPGGFMLYETMRTINKHSGYKTEERNELKMSEAGFDCT